MTPSVSPLAQAVVLARKDLSVDRRTGEVFGVVAPFGAVALFLVPLGVGAETALLTAVGPALFWLIVLLFGVLVTMRGGAVDSPAHRALLLLSGVTPRVRLAGRALGNTALLLAFQLVIAPVAIVLYAPDLGGWPWLLPMVVLVAAGLGTLGAFADLVSEGLAGRTTLGPLLVTPITVPLLLGAVGVIDATRYERPAWPWLVLVLAVDLASALSAAWCVRHLEDQT